MSEEKLTMDDFSAELEASFKKIEEGDMLTGTVISVDEKEVIVARRAEDSAFSRSVASTRPHGRVQHCLPAPGIRS